MASGPEACIEGGAVIHRQNPPWVWEWCSVKCAVLASLVWPFQIPPSPRSTFHHSAPLCFLCCDTHISTTWHNSAFDSSSSSKQFIEYPCLQWMRNLKPLSAPVSTILGIGSPFQNSELRPDALLCLSPHKVLSSLLPTILMATPPHRFSLASIVWHILFIHFATLITLNDYQWYSQWFHLVL